MVRRGQCGMPGRGGRLCARPRLLHHDRSALPVCSSSPPKTVRAAVGLPSKSAARYSGIAIAAQCSGPDWLSPKSERARWSSATPVARSPRSNAAAPWTASGGAGRFCYQRITGAPGAPVRSPTGSSRLLPAGVPTSGASWALQIVHSTAIVAPPGRGFLISLGAGCSVVLLLLASSGRRLDGAEQCACDQSEDDQSEKHLGGGDDSGEFAAGCDVAEPDGGEDGDGVVEAVVRLSVWVKLTGW